MRIQFLQMAALLLLLCVAAAGCSRIQVSQDYDTKMHFPKLHTYAWKPPVEKKHDDIRENNPLLHKRFHENIDSVLMEKGYTRKNKPDFLVDYEYSIKTKIYSEPYSTGIGFGIGPHYRYSGFGISTAPQIRQYDVGILAINVYDAESEIFLWRGMGSEEISSHPTPQQTSEMVRRLVEAILFQFPPQ
jgi:hypothetical protein